MQRKNKSIVYTREKKSSQIETIPDEAETPNLLDKDFYLFLFFIGV